MNMKRGLQKKRISWASDVNLCQIRMFLSEESPSQVGLSAQDHLQAKTSLHLHSSGTTSDDNLPPGFEAGQPVNQLNNMLSQIPVIKWKFPPRFVLNVTWQVVTGEESKEVELQSKREMRVLEAVYPRPSAIPLNPASSIEDIHHDDQNAPMIPITPIEDEDAANDASYDSEVPMNNHIKSQASFMSPGITNPPTVEKSLLTEKFLDVAPDVAAAASAAFTAIMKTNEQGNMIDQELLIQILNNPKLIEKLVTDYGAVAKTQTISMPVSPSVNIPQHQPLSGAPAKGPFYPHPNGTKTGASSSVTPVNGTIYLHPNGTETVASSSVVPANGPFYPHSNGTETVTSSSVATANGPFYPHPTNTHPYINHRPHGFGSVPVPSQPSMGPPKDFTYYKTLIQQHGGERQDHPLQFGSGNSHHNNHQLGVNQDMVNDHKPRDLMKPKIMKPCIYFNSSRGCRHGSNCAFQHDNSLQQRGNNIPELHNGKRLKLDREITGTYL